VPVESDSFGMDPFFLSWVIPPDSGTSPLPRSVTFVADVSSSMEGRRMEQLREAMHEFLNQLNEGDRFNIITFSTGVLAFRSSMVAANVSNIAEARRFVDSRTALGLTNISEALRVGLSMDYHAESANALVFLTDGQPSWGITNQAAIQDSARAWNLQDVRIYPISVGSEGSVTLMRNIAIQSGGFHTEVLADDSIAVSVQDHLKRISMPNLVGLTLDYGTLRTMDVHPQVLPNVAVGGRVIQTGRYDKGGVYPVTLAGRVVEVPFSVTRDVFFSDPASNNRAVARLWAQAKIEALLNEISRNGEQKELVDAVIDLSIRFGILTKYTALYADPDDKGSATSVPGDRPIETIKVHIAPQPASADADVTVELNNDMLGQNIVVELFNALGQRIGVLFDGVAQGRMIHVGRLVPDGTSVPAGIYYVVVRTASLRHVEPIVIQGAGR
jgi:Ca-activated chloride channel homolog